MIKTQLQQKLSDRDQELSEKKERIKNLQNEIEACKVESGRREIKILIAAKAKEGEMVGTVESLTKENGVLREQVATKQARLNTSQVCEDGLCRPKIAK